MAANNNLSSSSPWFSSSSSSRRASPIPTWRQQQQHVATTTLICSRSSASVATSDKSNYSSRERSPLAHTKRRVAAVNQREPRRRARTWWSWRGRKRACVLLVTELLSSGSPASPTRERARSNSDRSHRVQKFCVRSVSQARVTAAILTLLDSQALTFNDATFCLR